MRSILAVLLLAAACSAQDWVSYSARYTETSTTLDSGGREERRVRNLEEFRSTDGSTATFDIRNGERIGGELWLSCGSLISLDYSNKSAIVSKRPAPHHMQIPTKDQPLGTAMIAGLLATGWPVRMSVGTGSVWVDTNDDIMLKLEVHTNQNGIRSDYVKQAQSISVNASIPESEFAIPSGFASKASATEPVCGNR